MTGVRHLLRSCPLLAMMIVTAALALRVLVPGGYMPSVEDGRLVVKVCSDTGHGPATMALAIPGLKHPDPAPAATGKCAYADLAQALTGGADPILLAGALAFALLLALTFVPALPPRGTDRLRPPLRGPPAFA